MAPPESIELVATERGNDVRIEQWTAAAAPRAGRLLARAAASSSSARRPARSRGARTPVGPSDKQRPSHRKLRRWNNDRFVGTSSEQIHVMLENDGFGGDAMDQYWSEFYMPNYPREYRSEFAKLSTDESRKGKSARERFLKGEVARNSGGKDDEEGKGKML